MEQLTDREAEILNLIISRPTISRSELAHQLHISPSAVGTHLHNLSKKGYILGRKYILAPDKQIVVIGGCNIDIKGTTPQYQPHTSNPGQIVESPGGVGRNIAVNLGTLDNNVVLLSVLGTDHFGEKILTSLKKTGVNTEYIKRVDSKRSGLYLAHLNQDGDLIGAISDMDILQDIDIPYLEEHRKLIENASILTIDTNLNQKIIERIIETAHQNNITLVAEPVSQKKAKKLKPYLNQIDYLTPSLNEAESLLGLKSKNDLSFDNRLKQIKKTYHNQIAKTTFIVTCGHKGVYLLQPQHDKLIPAPKLEQSENSETTGAGDALTAVLVHGLNQNWDLVKTIKTGIKAAQITIRSENTVNKDLKTLLKEVN